MSGPHNINPVLLRPIDGLEITTRTLDLLKEANIYYIADLVHRTETELKERRFTSSDVVEIRTALWSHGLDLSKD